MLNKPTGVRMMTLIPVREKRHSVLTHPNKLLKKHTKLSQRLQEKRKKK
jgi:hypothetical protein